MLHWAKIPHIRGEVYSKPGKCWKGVWFGELGIGNKLGFGGIGTWLPIPSSYMVQSLVIGLNPEAKVSSLLDPATGGWNVSLIQASFYASEADTICNLLPSLLGNLDKRIWIGSSNGCYSVKSCYHFKMNRRAQARGEALRSQENKDVWKAI
jgi:hypothetical protein